MKGINVKWKLTCSCAYKYINNVIFITHIFQHFLKKSWDYLLFNTSILNDIFFNFSADYEKARKKIAEFTSDLQTDTEEASKAKGLTSRFCFPKKLNFKISENTACLK